MGLYSRYVEGPIVLVTVYVDDMPILGTSSSIDVVVDNLRACCASKDIGRVPCLFHMEVKYEPGVMLCLSQTVSIDRMLKQFQMEQAKPVR